MFLVAAFRARRTGVIGSAIFAFVLCVCLGAARPAKATVTSLAVSTLSLSENSSFSGTVATFSTDDPFDTFSYSIDWGDGTTDTGPASVTGDAGSVSGTHTYTEDGTYTLTVRVTESGGSPSTRSATATVTVGEADASLVAVTPTTISEGGTFSGPVAYLTDSGSPDSAANFSASINWGDGTTTPGTVSGAAGSFTISGSHTYTDELRSGAIKVKVSETGVNGALGSVQDQISVTERDILTAHTLSFAASDGAQFTGNVATFSIAPTTTPASDLSATIGWGDGTTTSGVVSGSGGTLIVSGSHTFNSPPGNYAVSVHLTEDTPGTATATATSTATLAAGKPSAVTQGAKAVTVSAAMLTGTVDPNGGATTYWFQFGRTTAYGSSSVVRSVGSGNIGRGVSASLSRLTPGTTYHYRIVATNSKGTSVGSDQILTTIGLVGAVKARRGGSFVVVVNAPGPGAISVVLMDGKTAFGRALVKTRHAGRIKIVVHPSRSARLLLVHHQRIKLVLRVTFTPRKGRAITTMLRGLHPVSSIHAVMAGFRART